jgi:hypothetical protein
MSRSIAQLLPIPELQEKRIQVDIPASLYEKAEAIKSARRLKWNQIFKALLEKFVEDLEEKPKPDSFQLKKVNLNPEDCRSHWK